MNKDKGKNGDKHHPTSIIPGEITLYNVLPKGWTLVSLMGMALFGGGYFYFQIEQMADDIAALKIVASETKLKVSRHEWKLMDKGYKE